MRKIANRAPDRRNYERQSWDMILVRPQRMKPSKTQMIIAYAASTFLMLAVFHKPLRLADYWETAFLIATGLCWITFFLFAPSAEIQSHDVRGAGLATEPCAPQKFEFAISVPHHLFF